MTARALSGSLALVLAVTLVATTPVLRAQPAAGAGMPDLRAISGRPLPDPGMPAGMVTVRVARKMPSNGVADAEITAIVVGPSGEARKRSAKTDAGGRATFEALPAGHRFHAEVIVDKEKLATETFTIPDAGGIRTMLIAGLPPDGGGGDGDAGGPGKRKPFSLGFVAGVAALDAKLPVGVVTVLALDEHGRPLANQRLELGKVTTRGVEVLEQVTGADGRARFAGLVPPQPPGGSGASGAGGAGGAEAGIAAAVIMDRGDLRVSTDGFQIPNTGGGVSVELRVPQTTTDSSIITVGAGGRVILQVRDDGLSFIETLPLENHSDKLFDPGAGGVEIPLPSEAVGAEGAEGGHKIEVRKGIGIAVHGPIPPRRVPDPSGKSPDEITFGFILPTHRSTRDFEQRFPNGLGEFTFVTDQVPGLEVDSPQISGRQERELGGKKYWLMRGQAIPPGGTLRFTVRGLPAPDTTGRTVSGILALGLVFGATIFGRRRPGGSSAAKEQSARERLIQRRERLFSELMTVEARRTAGGPAPVAAATKVERDDLVRKLEGVYRELAAVDDQRAA